jgi:hypothetical protein
MIFILLTWLYITLVAYIIGCSCNLLLSQLAKLETTPTLHFSLHCISGLVAIGFLSGVVCLFIPLNGLANLFLLILALALLFFNRKQIRQDWKVQIKALRDVNMFFKLAFLYCVLIFLYWSYMESSHHDDGLYYSTTIKWLQEYGTVKGIANLNSRIGFNSAWNVLQAIFGFRFLQLGLSNDLNGLLLCYVLLYAITGMQTALRRNNHFSTGIRALFFLPILFFHWSATSETVLYNVNFLESSSPDVPVCVMLWLIFLLFLEAGEETQTATFRRNTLLMFGYSAWLITLKLSAVPVLLLPIFNCLVLIRKKQSRVLTFGVASAFLVAAPWLIRNVLVSGYLIFPFSKIDLFNVDWKLPLSSAQWHENSVRAFAINAEADLYHPFSTPFSIWFPEWFRRLSYIQTVLIVGAMLSTCIFLAIGLAQLLRRRFAFFRIHAFEIAYIGAANAGILFWLLKGPDFRLGYGFLVFYCVFAFCAFCRYFLEQRYYIIPRLAIVVVVLSVPYYYGNQASYAIDRMFKKPLKFRMPEKMEQIGDSSGKVINVVFAEDSWNAPLPVANNNDIGRYHPVFRGDKIEDGFRSAPGPFDRSNQ